VSGSGISQAICKSAPHSRQTTPATHHSVFTGQIQIPFLPPNQQCQSTEGNVTTNTGYLMQSKTQPMLSTNHYMATPDKGDLAPSATFASWQDVTRMNCCSCCRTWMSGENLWSSGLTYSHLTTETREISYSYQTRQTNSKCRKQLTVTAVTSVDLTVEFLHLRELGKHFCHHTTTYRLYTDSTNLDFCFTIFQARLRLHLDFVSPAKFSDSTPGLQDKNPMGFRGISYIPFP